MCIRELQDQYIADRLTRSRGRDDRRSKYKLYADARFRGKVGAYAANKVIEEIDKYKSWR